MNNDEVIIGHDGELVIPEKFTDPQVLLELPNLFLVDPEHELLISDKMQPQTWKRTLIAILIAIILGAGFILVTLYFGVKHDWNVSLLAVGLLLGIAFIVFPLMITLFSHLPASKEEVLYQRGRLIIGYITRYKERKREDDLIDYQFTTPDGRELNIHDQVVDRVRKARLEAEGKDTSNPEVGTPLAILYLNDNNFKLL